MFFPWLAVINQNKGFLARARLQGLKPLVGGRTPKSGFLCVCVLRNLCHILVVYWLFMLTLIEFGRLNLSTLEMFHSLSDLAPHSIH